MKTNSSQTFRKKRKRQHFPIHSISPVTLIPKPKTSQEIKTSTHTFICQRPNSCDRRLHRSPERERQLTSVRQCVSASVRALQAQGLPGSSACPLFSPRPVPPQAHVHASGAENPSTVHSLRLVGPRSLCEKVKLRSYGAAASNEGRSSCDGRAKKRGKVVWTKAGFRGCIV